MSNWLNKLERRLEPFAIQNINLYIVIAQTAVLLLVLLQRLNPLQILFVPNWFLAGDYWRVLSFVAMPPPGKWFVAFALYLFYLYGSALQQHMGVVRYNLFLFVGYALTVGLAFVSPNAPATNLFLGGAVFLAFAHLHPDFVLNLFFVLPVKIKWLALISWVGYGYTFIVGGMSARMGVLAATGNFLLFFGQDLVEQIRTGRRRVQHSAQRSKLRRELAQPMHRCSVCQRDSETDPDLGFRYRTEGDKEVCYCEDHLPPRG